MKINTIALEYRVLAMIFICSAMGSAFSAWGAETVGAAIDQSKDQGCKKISAGEIEFRDIHVFTLENPVSGVPVLPHDNLVPAAVSGSARTNGMRVVAAKGEYESLSVVIHARKDIYGLILEAGDFQQEGDGQIIPQDEIDIYAVKCWYQSGDAWIGWRNIKEQWKIRTLTPELLLKNDGLVRADEGEEKNYLTLQFPEGKKEIWISDPQEKSGEGRIFRPEEFPVRDSKALLPLDLKAGINKQYWLTIRVPEDAEEGMYLAQITIKDREGELGKIPIHLRVLPFLLPLPKTWYDAGRDFISSVYYLGRLIDSYPTGSISCEYKSEEQLRAELRDMLAHNIFNPTCYQFNNLGTYLRIRNELGMKGPLFWRGTETGKPQDEAGIKKLQEKVRKALAIAGTYGVKELYVYGIDEAEGEALLSERKAWEAVHQAGAKVFAAGQKGHFEKVGDLLDLLIMAYAPVREEAQKWHSAGHRIFCYANPQTGPENPEQFRRGFGLLLWKADYDGAMTYAYQHSFGNIYNDFDHKTYRDHVLSYPTVDGVIPTLAIEGYREGIDDIRYGTFLKGLIIENKDKGGAKAGIAEAAGKYLETLDTNRNPGVIRLEMIEYILQLLDAGRAETGDGKTKTGKDKK